MASQITIGDHRTVTFFRAGGVDSHIKIVARSVGVNVTEFVAGNIRCLTAQKGVLIMLDESLDFVDLPAPKGCPISIRDRGPGAGGTGLDQFPDRRPAPPGSRCFLSKVSPPRNHLGLSAGCQDLPGKDQENDRWESRRFGFAGAHPNLAGTSPPSEGTRPRLPAGSARQTCSRTAGPSNQRPPEPAPAKRKEPAVPADWCRPPFTCSPRNIGQQKHPITGGDVIL